ncbi:hypothetical protein CO652_15670 [Rhizobium sp. H4]|nr:hypothetical protein CO652_15670 [Rhizobium sp. H4]
MPSGESHSSVAKYIRSIGRHYVLAVVVMTVLIGATFLTVKVALDRARRRPMGGVSHLQRHRLSQVRAGRLCPADERRYRAGAGPAHDRGAGYAAAPVRLCGADRTAKEQDMG